MAVWMLGQFNISRSGTVPYCILLFKTVFCERFKVTRRRRRRDSIMWSELIIVLFDPQSLCICQQYLIQRVFQFYEKSVPFAPSRRRAVAPSRRRREVRIYRSSIYSNTFLYSTSEGVRSSDTTMERLSQCIRAPHKLGNLIGWTRWLIFALRASCSVYTCIPSVIAYSIHVYIYILWPVASPASSTPRSLLFRVYHSLH